MRRFEDRTIGEAVPSERADRTEENATLRSLFALTPILAFFQDPQGRIRFVTSDAARSLGLTREELEDSAWQAHGRRSDLMNAIDDLRKETLLTGKPSKREVFSPLDARYYDCRMIPSYGGDGELVGTFATAVDITERKEMEGLRAGEKWFSSLIENAPVAVAMSRKGMTAYGNPRYLEMFGYERIEEVIGKTFIEQIAPQDRGRALEFALNIEKGRPAEAEMELIGLRKDGSMFPFHAAITRIDLGDGLAVIGFFTDITERKAVEEEMVHARRKFESLFSASNEGIALHDIVYDREGRIVDYRIIGVNPAYERIIGISKSKAVGRLASELYGTDEPPYLDILTQVCVTGRPATLEIYFAPMGKHFFISTFSPAQGQFATIFIDITERKQLEEELEEARSRAEIYVDLLIHDISNYNTAAMGYLQLAEMRLELDERGRKLIVRPLQVLGNSSELIANVRDLKRVEAGRERTQSLDIYKILREVKEAYEDPPGREVTINLLGSNNCWVLASGLIRDAFSNIVSNSIKHSSGPVTVDISVERPYRDGIGQVRVSIEDNGPGVPDERKDTIFDRSMMGLTKPVSRGLGLYLVKRLVEEYDGEVWVEDRVPGDHTKGAKFVITLPAASSG